MTLWNRNWGSLTVSRGEEIILQPVILTNEEYKVEKSFEK